MEYSFPENLKATKEQSRTTILCLMQQRLKCMALPPEVYYLIVKLKLSEQRYSVSDIG